MGKDHIINVKLIGGTQQEVMDMMSEYSKNERKRYGEEVLQSLSATEVEPQLWLVRRSRNATDGDKSLGAPTHLDNGLWCVRRAHDDVRIRRD